MRHSALILTVVFATAAARADTNDERYLEGLRNRGLFSLAEKYCRERLAEFSSSEPRQAELAIELSRTYAAHALHEPIESRAPLWQKAREVTDDFARRSANSPRLLLVRAQGALAGLAEAESLRPDADPKAKTAAVAEAARQAIGKAISQLKQLDAETAAEIRRRNRAAQPAAGTLTFAELTALDNHLRYELTRAYRTQGLTYDAGSNERVDALAQAVELLRGLSQLPVEDPLCWTSRLDEVACHRFLGHHDVAQQRLAALMAEGFPAGVKPRATAEQIRLYLALGQLNQALDELQKPGVAAMAAPADSSELDEARLEAFVAAWQSASKRGDRREATKWEERATDQVGRIEKLYGTYRARPAEALLAASITNTEAASFETVARAAAGYYRSGQFEAAIAAYDRAAREAQIQHQADRAFELALTAATIHSEQRHLHEAMLRYRQAALDAPGNPRAAEAHLLAVYQAAQEAQTHAKPAAPAAKQYRELLEEHLAKWPKDPTAAKARWWLAQLLEGERAWEAALAAYRGVPADSPQAEAAIEGEGRCLEQSVAQLRVQGKPHEPFARQAAARFEKLVPDADLNSRMPWSPAARAAALTAARLWLADVRGGDLQAEELLRTALAGSPEPSAEWKIKAQALLIAALASQERIDEAAKLLKQLSGGAPAELIGLAERLIAMQDRVSAPRRRDVATLSVSAVKLLSSEHAPLDPATQLAVERIEADALGTLGTREEALAAWQRLAKVYPDEGAVQERLAEMLSQAKDAAGHKAALDKWVEIQRKSRPGTPRWFRANYGAARADLALGRKSQARSIIKLTAANDPDFGGDELKAKFLKLLAACGE